MKNVQIVIINPVVSPAMIGMPPLKPARHSAAATTNIPVPVGHMSLVVTVLLVMENFLSVVVPILIRGTVDLVLVQVLISTLAQEQIKQEVVVRFVVASILRVYVKALTTGVVAHVLVQVFTDIPAQE